ncbi:winged helix-turn-helix domain-containing protein [Jiangella muralis]|uniref:winged helix-turn-helix domain-containing protein n=1 Tax=Jiangella muralis TaxID=702383 RepID=UPI00069D7329|nr:winged helix-turn-helix domain-containing protein [Jiangella muralis]
MENFDPDPQVRGYVFVRLADHLLAEIAESRITVGARLANEREMARTYGVGIGTVRRSLELLRERGIVETYPSKGTFVIATTPIDDSDDAGARRTR